MPGFSSVSNTEANVGTSVDSSEIVNDSIVNEDIKSDAGIVLSKLATDPLARANHTGTQAAATISDFSEAVDDRVAALIAPSGLLVETYDDNGNSLGYNVPAAAASDINTGTSTTTAMTPDAFAESNAAKRVVQILVSDPAGSAITTGDSKAIFRIPAAFNGMNLTAVAACLTTVSSSGAPNIQIHRRRSASNVDMLSTALTIDANEEDSSTAATPAVINGSNDDVQTGDQIHADIDGAGTGAKGLLVELTFNLP